MPKPTDPRLVDEVSGLSNEWHFRIVFDFAFAGGDRGVPITLVLFEIRGFERYRREHGSDVATRMIRDFATSLDRTTREMDVTVRLHGARFLSLLRDCNMQGGLVFADRLQAQTRFLEDVYGLTLAVGVATYEKEMEASDDLLDAAMRALARSVEDEAEALHTSRDP